MAGLSHNPESSSPQLFVEDGTPIAFYVDPGSVFSRPKLIRKLKSAGASIASDPKTADFILVQSDATTGQHFIRDWSDEKKVLEVAWVSKSIAAGRPLKEADRWGDCEALENVSVGAEDVDPNHLPTPRITPVEQLSNPPQQPPPHPTSESRHSSQQPSVINGNFASPMPPNQMPQFPQQPGGPILYQPPQQFNTGIVIDQHVYSMVLTDILQRQGILPWAGLPGPGMQNGMAPGFFVPQGINPMMNPMMNPMQNSQMYPQPPGIIPMAHHASASPLSTSDSLPPSFSHRSSADVKGKGKGRYVSQSASRVASSSSSHEVFVSDAGEPLTFYVAIEVHNRAATLHQIKRHGGQISTQITADFAVLSSRSKDFENLLDTVISSNGTPVKPAFVSDSVEQSVLLDPSKYEFDLPPKLQRKVQKAPSSSPKKTDAEKRQAEKKQAEKRQAKTLRQAQARKSKKDAAVKAERASPDLSRLPSPSPPLENTRVLLNGNKYRYPDVENEYVLRYATVLYERNKDMSLSAMSAKLHAKMPHHSANAWLNHISTTLRDGIENVRKKAFIAFRKEEHLQQSKADQPPAKRPKLSESDSNAKTEAAIVNADEQFDLNTIAHFFANDDETDGDEARVWNRLEQQTRCRTAESWESFYKSHHPEVIRLFEELVREQDESLAE